MPATKVFLICTGLGEVQRGYESFTRECFDALKDEPELQIYLYKGGGDTVPAQREYRLWNLKRKYAISKWLAKQSGKDAYFFEQLSFLLSLMPSLMRHKPDLIYFSDFLLGCWLAHVRRFLGMKYKLLFSNGAPNGPPFPLFDHVHQLTQIHRQEAIMAGEPESKHTVLPYGFQLPSQKDALLTEKERVAMRLQLGLPEDKTIIISVGNINTHHKRMDYLVREFAQISRTQKDLYLLILGQISEESEAVLQLASELIHKDQYQIMTVPYTRIKQYYQCADLFVLCSLGEGFGRVYLEALMYGLPVVAHNFMIAREVMKSYAAYEEMDKEGKLAAIFKSIAIRYSFQQMMERHEYVKEKFSWYVLKDDYTRMLKKLI